MDIGGSGITPPEWLLVAASIPYMGHHGHGHLVTILHRFIIGKG
jgi:hypothetical protein